MKVNLLSLILLSAGCTSSHKESDKFLWSHINSHPSIPATQPTTQPSEDSPKPMQHISSREYLAHRSPRDRLPGQKDYHQERYAVQRFNDAFNLKGPTQLRSRKNELTFHEKEYDNIGLVKAGFFRREDTYILGFVIFP
ncbi:hypothetical protein KW787_00235 [Candidatus Pacearchaeota archaeon]|nr:hypothetical protein [Candidatus Pacearchaeota archaeon]